MSIRFPFFRRKKKTIENKPSHINLPKHIAIIMDGNGRWARKRGLPRIAGHKEGMNAVKNIVDIATEYKIETLTLFAFSTENWKRPKKEVDYLMRLPKEFLHKFLPDLIKNNVRVNIIGEFDELPQHTKEAIEQGEKDTAHNDGLMLNFALNYGSRSEILKAVKQIATDVKNDTMNLEDLDEEMFQNYLYTCNIADPDLVIRTSGEKRLSNFLLWQTAYTELWFTDVLWPDFTEEVFAEAIIEYQKRKRRYGGI